LLDHKDSRPRLGHPRNRSLRGQALSRRGRLTLLGFVVSLGLVAAVPVIAPRVETALRSMASNVAGQEVAANSTAGFYGEATGVVAPEPLFSRLPVGMDNEVYAYADEPTGSRSSGVTFASATSDPFAAPRLVEVVPAPIDRPELVGPLRVEYSLDAELTKAVLKILRAARVERGHVIVLDPSTGRVLAYVSTDPESFPPTRAYPAASLIKVVTANAVLETSPARAKRPCRFRGSPYKLTRSRLKQPKSGREVSLEVALATSNNQCFAQFAVNDVGSLGMLNALDEFGWLSQSGPGHDAGAVELGGTDYDLGKLGCGLAGCRITPLHAARLAATLATGVSVEPWWVDRVTDARGNELSRPASTPQKRVLSPARAQELRQMMVRTTTRGTARGAFRDRRGRPRLGSIKVAGKTGNLSGREPNGRYEWFIAAAPAEAPTIAIAVVQVHGHLWWKKSSEIAADVLSDVFCEGRRCSPALANRFTGKLGSPSAAMFLSEDGRTTDNGGD
jgi:peptidoglycan glycosyltransferase